MNDPANSPASQTTGPSDISPFIRMLQRRDILSEEDIALIERLPMRKVRFQPGEDIVAEGSRPKESCMLLHGLAARSQSVSGGGRQITALHISGDFVDLHAYLLKTMDHSVVAMGPCEVSFVPHTAIRSVTEQSHHLGRLFWLSTVIDGAIQRTWITCLGRRSVEQQIAHLFCELYRRFEAAGAAKDFRFELPLTQAQLADVLGLSIVHVNKKLQQLKTAGLIEWKNSTARILDYDRLASLAEFDPTYLSLQNEPR